MTIQTTEKKTLSKTAANQMRAKIRNVVEAHAQGSMDICWALWETDHTLVRIGGVPVPLWEAWGYTSWIEFVGKEFHMYPTTAYNYMRVWETFYIDLAGAWDVNNQPGITKMLILANGADLNKRNTNKWLRKACKTTCRKLRAEVFGTDEIRHFSADVTGGEFKTLLKGIEAGREAFGEDLPRGEVLARITKEWLASVKAVRSRRKAS